MILPAHTKPHVPPFLSNSSEGEDSTSDTHTGLAHADGKRVSLTAGERDGNLGFVPLSGGHKDSYPTLASPTQGVRGRCRAQAPSTHLEHQAKHFHQAAVPDFCGKAPSRQSRGREQSESHPLSMDDIWRLLLRGSRALQGWKAARSPTEPLCHVPGESFSRNTGVPRTREPGYQRYSVQEERMKSVSAGLRKAVRRQKAGGPRACPGGSGGLEAPAGRRDGRTPPPGGETGLAGLASRGRCRARGSRRIRGPSRPPGFLV